MHREESTTGPAQYCSLGRTMLPLERDGLISIKDGILDRRVKELAVTKAGTERLQRAAKLWVEAQKEFEERFGARRAADLRGLLGEVVSCELGKAAQAPPSNGSRLERGSKGAISGGKD